MVQDSPGRRSCPRFHGWKPDPSVIDPWWICCCWSEIGEKRKRSPFLVRELAETVARLTEGQERQGERLDRFAETVAHNVSVQNPIRP